MTAVDKALSSFDALKTKLAKAVESVRKDASYAAGQAAEHSQRAQTLQQSADRGDRALAGIEKLLNGGV